MTKKELLEAIAAKVEEAHPLAKEIFLRGLKWKTKKELKKLLQRIKLVKLEKGDDSYDISTL
jgi:hypothetical protein